MKVHYSKFMVCIGALIAFCLHSSTAEAIFASVKSTGMAATCIAYPQDSLVGAYNPAGMVMIGNRYDLEAGWLHNKGWGTVRGNQSPLAPLVNGHFSGMRTRDIYPAGFGVNRTFCFSDFEVGIGLVMYNRNYQKTTYKHPFPLLGTSNLGLEYLNQTVAPIVSLRFCENHSIGISANCQLERLKVNGLERVDNALFSSNPGHVTNRGYNYSVGWTPTFGYFGQITDRIAIGVTYQPETTMRKLSKYSGFLVHGRLNVPRKIGAGISFRVLPCVTLAFDIEHIHWHPLKSFSNKLLNNGVLEQLGTSDGPGFGFRDQMYYRVGIDWQINGCWTVRAGFRHANTPIRRTQTTVNLLTLDCVEDFATCGATYAFNDCTEISGLFAWGFSKSVRGKGQTIPLIPFGGGTVSLKEQKYALGFALGRKF